MVSISSVATPPTFVTSPLPCLQFVTAAFVSTPVIDAAIELDPELKAPDEVKVIEPTPERSSPAATEVPPVDIAPRPEPPSPAPPPPPSVVAFPKAAAMARATEPAKRVEAAGFDAPVAHASQSHLGAAAVGTFDAAPLPGARQMGASTERNNTVIESGFNQASPGAQPTQQSRVIRDSGFGTSDNHDRPKVQEQPALQQTGFTDARVAEPIRRSQPALRAPAVVPAEVLSKPTPIYTEHARRLKVEGEVVLKSSSAPPG